MSSTRFRLLSSRRLRKLLLPAVLLLALSGARPAAAQTFAVGGGGMILNDLGSSSDLSGFSTFGGFVFVEMQLEENVGFQIRAALFDLPGTQPNTPKLTTTAETATISY